MEAWDGACRVSGGVGWGMQGKWGVGWGRVSGGVGWGRVSGAWDEAG